MGAVADVGGAGDVAGRSPRAPRTCPRTLLALAGALVLLCGLAGTLLASAAFAADAFVGSWSPAGPAASPRFDHTATTLADGRVLVVGGAADPVGTTLLAAVESYDVAGERWQTLASLATRRRLHSATLIAGGKVLVAGGQGSTGPLASAEVYDPAADTWSATAGSLSTARSGQTATPLPGGRVLLAGGRGRGGAPLASAEVYDPATNSFGATGSLSTARVGHSASVLPDGKVLLAGGTGAAGTPLSSAEVYDPATGSFGAGGALSAARSGHTASALPGGKLLLAAGAGQGGTPLSSAELYDAATNSFAAAPGALAVARVAHTATVLSDGRVLLTGGRAARSSTELYDPVSGVSDDGTFGLLASGSSDPGTRAGHSATLLADGRVLVAGGTSNSTAELYDPAVPRFSRSAVRQGRAGDAVVLGGPACRDGSPAPYCGKLLVAGEGKLTELFDPVKNRWSGCATGQVVCGSAEQPGNLSVERSGATLTLLDGPACRSDLAPGYCGKVLLVGGTAGGALPTDPGARVELYDPATGKWSSCDAMTSPSADCPAPYAGGAVREHSATQLADGRVLIAGGAGSVTVASARTDFYVYIPATGRWGPRGTLYNFRRNHRAVLLEGGPEQCADNCGKVLLIGGLGADGVERSAELVSINATDGGSSLPTPELTASRPSAHSATLLPTGQVVVVGGDGAASSAEFFDPKAGVTGGWGAYAEVPRARRGASHTATLLPAGGLLLAGGGETGTAELFAPYGGRSVFAAQGPARPQKALLLPPGPLSLCATSCGKVALTDANAVAASFGWLYTPPPELTRLGFSGGPAAGATPVTIEGRGLASVTSVRFGALEATSIAPDPASPDTKLVAISPPHPGGTVPVTVTSSGGTSASTEKTQFTYAATADPDATPNPPPAAGPPAASPPAASPPAAGPPAAAPPAVLPGILPAPIAPLGVALPDKATVAALAAEDRRALALRRCLRLARRQTGARRRLAQQRCLAVHGRTPGKVTAFSARALSSRQIKIDFRAAGSDRTRPPAARSYVIMQSPRPIRTARDLKRAQALCKGNCRFGSPTLAERLTLTVTGLRPKTIYYYTVAARDNVSGRLGPRSQTVKVKTR